jgi:hypothetical protein
MGPYACTSIVYALDILVTNTITDLEQHGSLPNMTLVLFDTDCHTHHERLESPTNKWTSFNSPRAIALAATAYTVNTGPHYVAIPTGILDYDTTCSLQRHYGRSVLTSHY